MISYAVTKRQKQIFDFLSKQHRETGIVPTVREIQKHFRFGSSNAVDSHLRSLEKKG